MPTRTRLPSAPPLRPGRPPRYRGQRHRWRGWGVICLLGVSLGLLLGVMGALPLGSSAPAVFSPPRSTLTVPVRWGVEQSPALRPLLGHYPYPEAADVNLVVVEPTDPVGATSAGGVDLASAGEPQLIQLHQEVADAFEAMVKAASRDGVWLVPMSGFRDRGYQARLFQQHLVRVGSPEAAARAIAPPGYSEHHTGYAVDLGDGHALWQAFDQTAAFTWMQHHGGQFGFELSFPPHNPQGIRYEPWHWRYVGSPTAQVLFGPRR